MTSLPSRLFVFIRFIILYLYVDTSFYVTCLMRIDISEPRRGSQAASRFFFFIGCLLFGYYYLVFILLVSKADYICQYI